jgi:hypothetical protein
MKLHNDKVAADDNSWTWDLDVRRANRWD